MSESLTGEPTGAPASNEPTGQAPVDTTAESNSQDAISQEAVSTDSSAEPKQTENENSGAVEADDGLAKFAKGQGIDDVSELSERELKLLKVAQANQKAFRENSSGPKVTEAASGLGGKDAEARIAALEYERTTDKFWSQEGRDSSLEPKMVEILNEKVKNLTPTLGEEEAKNYAFNLSRDLDTLYDMARLRSGAVDTDAAIEQGRREARDSIRKGQAAGAGEAHAVTQGTSTPKITREWLATQYDPSDPEQRKAVDAAMARGDLY